MTELSEAVPNAQARAVLSERAAAGGRPMHEATVSESRAAQWEWVPYMGDPQPVAVEHRFIPGPTAELPVRVYHPGGEGPLPALVAFHGGCWIVGNIDVADGPFRALASTTGCVVVSVNYQKAPEHPFPVPLDDCYAAFVWTVVHADELGIDPTRVGVFGDSAGGNLAAAVSLKAQRAEGPRPAVQVLVYPAVDASLETPSAKDFAEGYGLTTADMAWSWRQYAPDPAVRDDPLVAPFRAASLAGQPPAVVVTAGFDVLRDEGLAYAHRLEADGVLVNRLHYPGTIHGFLWMGGVVDECRQMLTDVADRLRTQWENDS
jgi:acetyl esterase